MNATRRSRTGTARRTAELDREHERIAALQEYALLDGPVDDEIEAVVRVAAAIAGVPTASLNLIDASRQCQLSAVGFPAGVSDRDDSMCALAFRAGNFVHVPDARRHPTHRTNPWVTGELGTVRFYASAPLVTADGHALGSLCVFDERRRELTTEQIDRLTDLAQVLVALIEGRRLRRNTAAKP